MHSWMVDSLNSARERGKERERERGKERERERGREREREGEREEERKNIWAANGGGSLRHASCEPRRLSTARSSSTT